MSNKLTQIFYSNKLQSYADVMLSGLTIGDPSFSNVSLSCLLSGQPVAKLAYDIESGLLAYDQDEIYSFDSLMFGDYFNIGTEGQVIVKNKDTGWKLFNQFEISNNKLMVNNNNMFDFSTTISVKKNKDSKYRNENRASITVAAGDALCWTLPSQNVNLTIDENSWSNQKGRSAKLYITVPKGWNYKFNFANNDSLRIDKKDNKNWNKQNMYMNDEWIMKSQSKDMIYECMIKTTFEEDQDNFLFFCLSRLIKN